MGRLKDRDSDFRIKGFLRTKHQLHIQIRAWILESTPILPLNIETDIIKQMAFLTLILICKIELKNTSL